MRSKKVNSTITFFGFTVNLAGILL